MIRRVTLVESQPKTLDLDDDQALALNAAGQRLASNKQWWGRTSLDENRTVIRCQRQTGGKWSVHVNNAVGLIAVGQLQIEVQPKIPLNHFIHLLGESRQFPRMDEVQTRAASDKSLWELVAQWYLTETERLLRQGILRDYQEIRGWLPAIRGRANPPNTCRALASGRLEADCEYEEFDTDTPLNRTLKEAARLVSRSTSLAWTDRRRALAIITNLADAGGIQANDLEAILDRRSRSYSAPIMLARHIIRGQGRTIKSGPELAWTFLLRTPDLVEEGVRSLLKRHLGSRWTVVKQGRQVPGSSLSFNPDLLIAGGVATGDVKYKWLGDDWKRSDLYQALAFAVAFETQLAALVGFRSVPIGISKFVKVGDIEVQEFSWIANSEQTPEDSGKFLADEIDTWLQSKLALLDVG